MLEVDGKVIHILCDNTACHRVSMSQTTLIAIFHIYVSVPFFKGFPVGSAVKNMPTSAGDTRHEGSVPGWGRSPGVGNGNPVQYSCLENSMGRGARWATVHRVAKSQT